MSLLSGLGKVVRSAYRYVRYGKQVGKTAKNGAKVFKRAGNTVGLDKDGKIIRSVKTTQTSKFTHTVESKTPIPFSDDYRYSRRMVAESDDGTYTRIFRCKKSPSGYQADIYDTPWHIDLFKNRKTGAIDGVKDVITRSNSGRVANNRYGITNGK